MVDWIASTEAIAMHVGAASAGRRSQQSTLRPMELPRIYSTNANEGKSEDEDEEPIHFSSAYAPRTSAAGQSIAEKVI
jgi:hypothetical protein